MADRRSTDDRSKQHPRRRDTQRASQLELPLFLAPVRAVDPVPASPVAQAAEPKPAPASTGPKLRVIHGGGQRRTEPLDNRDAVVRVLVEAGADLLLRRISPERAEEIERSVDQIMDLFDRVDAMPVLMPVLRRRLDELEALMQQTRALRVRRQG